MKFLQRLKDKRFLNQMRNAAAVLASQKHNMTVGEAVALIKAGVKDADIVKGCQACGLTESTGFATVAAPQDGEVAEGEEAAKVGGPWLDAIKDFFSQIDPEVKKQILLWILALIGL